MTTPRETSTSSPAPRRGALPAMVIGAAVGLVAGQAIESATGGADPAFAGAVGGALGAALGRSGWIRVNAARDRGVSPLLAVAVLLARIAGCVLLGVAFVGTLAGTSAMAVRTTPTTRVLFFVLGAVLLVGTAVGEHRWIRRGRAHGA